MMELVWVLMYTVVTWAGDPGGLKRYEPMFQRMDSYAHCVAGKATVKRMETNDRAFQAVRCEELELPIRD